MREHKAEREPCTTCGGPVTVTRILAREAVDGFGRLVVRCPACGVLTFLVADPCGCNPATGTSCSGHAGEGA